MHQVQEHLPELRRRRPPPAAGRAPGRRQRRLARWRQPRAGRPRRDQPVQVERPADGPALAGVGEHLLAQVGGARGRPARPGRGTRAAPESSAAAAPGQAGVAEDAGQQVVEVVGHAAGQHAQRLQLLGLLEVLLEALLPSVTSWSVPRTTGPARRAVESPPPTRSPSGRTTRTSARSGRPPVAQHVREPRPVVRVDGGQEVRGGAAPGSGPPRSRSPPVTTTPGRRRGPTPTTRPRRSAGPRPAGPRSPARCPGHSRAVAASSAAAARP